MKNIYTKGLGIFVGAFDEIDLITGTDKKVLEKYQKEYPQYKYTNTKIIKENNVRKLAIWICSACDFKI